MTDQIKSIDIENFQAHKKIHLEFGRHITSITGPSDRGKSAIIRALIWVMTNRPTGDSFIRYGTDECRVTVEIGQHTVQRIKGKKRNVYILDGVEFKALKSDVPEEVQKVFNIGSNNIQSQFDPIFWFSDTAGEVGRNLNQIVNLDIIDYVLGEIQSKSKQVKTELDVLDNMIAEQEKALENADTIESILGIIRRVDAFQLEQEKLLVKQESLKEVISNMGSLEGWLQRAKIWEETYRQLELLMNQYIESKNKTTSLADIIGDVRRLEKVISQQDVPESLEVTIERVESGEKTLRELRKNWKGLKNIVQNILETKKEIEEYEQEALAAEEELHQTIDNNVCPLCGRRGK